MARIRKAWALGLKGCDCEGELSISHHPTAGKAKYSFLSALDWFDNLGDAFKSVRCFRAKQMDIILPDRMSECDDLSEEQIKIIKHTYASDYENMGFRNYYSCSINNENLMDLVSKGIMGEPSFNRNISTDATFYLSDHGIEIAKSLAPLYPLYRN